MKIASRVVLALIFVYVFLAILLGPALGAPPPEGSEDAQIMAGHKEWIEGQHAPSGLYCCDWSDGRPVFQNELRQNESGQWEVFYSSRHWHDGTDEWLTIPNRAILPQSSPLYFPIVWILGRTVYCIAFARNG